MNKSKLPELLSPAGSLEAFRAAIEGGADAIYMGGASFNARINAKNFTEEETAEAIKLAHAYGVKVYQTVNTMLLDREVSDLLSAAESSARAGIDAFIVSDLGAAKLLHAYLPEVELHASTQMSIHNASGARLLSEYGFTRVVPARELSADDIRRLVEGSPLEVEIFIHGALCVSHSGQCLFSSLVGGRSGNRGLCAQPCRLPYCAADKKLGESYPLSLKDLSLASHVREIIDSGVASLKIEGRMKSPEYVRGVTSVWRRLLDEGRDADSRDIQELSELFSRGGFTDGYYKSSIGHGMLGVRSEEDKQASREIEKFNKITRRVPIDAKIHLAANEPARLTLSSRGTNVTVSGDVCEAAINAPLDRETVTRCLSKLGDSCFSLAKAEVEICGEVMMPISKLNALRRSGVEKLLDAICNTDEITVGKIEKPDTEKAAQMRRVARFYKAEQISARAREFFDVILLPIEEYLSIEQEKSVPSRADGIIMPPVIFDSEEVRTRLLLERVAQRCPEYVLVTNLGQLEALQEILPNAELIADFRFNVGNTYTASFLEELGFDSYVASAELTLPQLRDLGGARGAVIYGRIPLMTLEKCVIRELYGNKNACRICDDGRAEMKDRRGFIFPILREAEHRNVIYNSLPTDMADRQGELDAARIYDRHFIFSTETAQEVDEVIYRYERGIACQGKVRRI